jgi:RNA polymerase sigma factor (sigma-70 family)
MGSEADGEAVSRGEVSNFTADDLGDAFDRFAPAILEYCFRHGEPSEAEDLMSVVFLEAWRCRASAVLVDDSLVPWLFGIAKNVLRTKRRSLRRNRAALERFRVSTIAELIEPAPDPADAVAAEDAALSLRREVRQALDRLSEKDREVVERCLLGTESVAQAAQALGIPEGTVKSRLHHARGAMRRLLRSDELLRSGEQAHDVEPPPANRPRAGRTRSRDPKAQVTE